MGEPGRFSAAPVEPALRINEALARCGHHTASRAWERARSGSKARYESFLRGAGLAPAAALHQGCRRCDCRCGGNPVCCA